MKRNNIMWGFFFIAAAALVVINQMGYFAGIGLWSLLLTILLIPVIGFGIRSRNFFNIFFGTAFLLIIYERPLGIQALVPWTVLAAALLLSIGFSILFRPNFKNWTHSDHWHANWGSHHSYESAEDVDANGSEVNCYVSFGDSSKYIHSDSFQKGYCECNLGHLSVYFDNVELHPNGAEITMNCSLGSMELYLPRHWNVKINVDAILGGVDEMPRREIPHGPTVTISGQVRLGALEIKYI